MGNYAQSNAFPYHAAQTRGGMSIGHHLLSSFPQLGAPTPCRGHICRRSYQPTIRAGGPHPPCGTRCMAPQLHEEKTGLPCALCESGRAKNNYFG